MKKKLSKLFLPLTFLLLFISCGSSGGDSPTAPVTPVTPVNTDFTLAKEEAIKAATQIAGLKSQTILTNYTTTQSIERSLFNVTSEVADNTITIYITATQEAIDQFKQDIPNIDVPATVTVIMNEDKTFILKVSDFGSTNVLAFTYNNINELVNQLTTISNSADGLGQLQSSLSITINITAITNKVDLNKSIPLTSTLTHNRAYAGGTYKWSVVSKPTNANAIFDNDAILTPKITVNTTGEYTVKLSVTAEGKVFEKEVKFIANRAIALVIGQDYSLIGDGSDKLDTTMDPVTMKTILDNENYETTTLLNNGATKIAILNYLNNAANNLVAGDILVFYYSGHGSNYQEKNGEPDAQGYYTVGTEHANLGAHPIDEADGKDEYLCTSFGTVPTGGNTMKDLWIIDDELDIIWKKFKPGVRIIMMSDSCHSGTVYKSVNGDSPVVSKAITAKDNTTMDAMLIHISGSTDAQLSWGGSAGGTFTNAFRDVYNAGGFNNYSDFHTKLISKINLSNTPEAQTSEIYFYGNNSPEFEAFKNSKPLSR